ncbi:hypothetical protein LTR08_005708 [Meristemomyces frigidus]|nr:hypothetical protein LTR08_005708 [Meristemomyces frigidus]
MSAGFVFVTFGNPNENGDFKKKIRSQAAIHSHRVAPRKGAKYAKYQARHQPVISKTLTASPDLAGPPTSDAFETSKPSASPRIPPRPTKKRLKTGAPHPEAVKHSPPSLARFHRRLSASPGLPAPAEGSSRSAVRQLYAANRELNEANIGRKRSRSRSASPGYELGDSTALIPYGRLPDPLYLDASRKDPFETSSVSYDQPWISWLLDFWYAGMLPKSRRLVKMTSDDMHDYTLWSRRCELVEPAMFYTSLTLASGIPVANGMLGVDKALWLRGQAVRALNEALDDPERATSNAVISSVGKIALHEHIYGDREAAHRIHRPAQQRYALDRIFGLSNFR